MGSSRFNSFLRDEWEDFEHELNFHTSLSGFFKECFPNISLANEVGKDLAIQKLATSANFAETHKAIAKLSNHQDFTEVQANSLAGIAQSNNQVYWILSDDDVFHFYSKLVDQHPKLLNEAELQGFQSNWQTAIEEQTDSEDDDIPF